MYSIARDVMSPHHGRNFQDMHLFLSHTRSRPGDRAIRISDLQPAIEKTHLAVYQFGPASNGVGLEGCINLMVWKGHMRFRYPSSDTKPTA